MYICKGHIFRRHGHGGAGEPGTSYFTIPWSDVVYKIKETNLKPDIIIPDTNNVNRSKYKRKYASRMPLILKIKTINGQNISQNKFPFIYNQQSGSIFLELGKPVLQETQH